MRRAAAPSKTSEKTQKSKLIVVVCDSERRRVGDATHATDDGRGVEVQYVVLFFTHIDITRQARERKGNRRGGKQGVFVDSSPEVGGGGGRGVGDLADLLDGR